MLIGELADRTGVSERRLRYYERVGLLVPRRQANGYRDYDAAAERTVVQIRALLAAGLPTRLIHRVLPCALEDGSLQPCPGVLNALRGRLNRIDQQVTELTRAQYALRQAIAVAEHRATQRNAH